MFKKLLLAASLLLGAVGARATNWPAVLDSDSNLYIATNNCGTTLSVAATSGATTLSVGDTTCFPSVGFVTIDDEAVKYTGKTATTFTGCTRGSDGTTAAAHIIGSVAFHSVIAAHHNVLKDELIAMTTYFLQGSVVHISTPTGFIGIGSATPDAPLYVNGAQHFYGIGTFDGATYAALDLKAAGTHKGYLALANAVLSGGSVNDTVLDGSAGQTILATGDVGRFYINSSGNALMPTFGQKLIFGSTNTVTIADGESPAIQSIGTDSRSGITIFRGSGDASSSGLYIGKSRNAINGSFTIVQSGDQLGRIVFAADDGTDYNTPAAIIAANVDGTPGANDMPGNLTFATTADGAASVTERMRITNSGQVGIGTASPTSGFTLDVRGAIGSLTSADGSPYTQKRISVYNDGTNWGYLGYGSDANMRIIYDHTGQAHSLIWGTSSATDNTGTFTPTMTLTEAGALGVGVTAPTILISVDQQNASAGTASEADQISVKGYGGANQSYAGIRFAMHEHTTGWGSSIEGYDDTGSYGGALTFLTGTGSATGKPTKRMTLGSSGGLQMGAPTGGDKGSGTINVAADIYKNNTAYTNPDYALESWATGKIKKFKKNPGASTYKGLLPLPQLEAYVRKNFDLPGVKTQHADKKGAQGAFDRSDVALEKIEEAHIYIIQLYNQIQELKKQIAELQAK